MWDACERTTRNPDASADGAQLGCGCQSQSLTCPLPRTALQRTAAVMVFAVLRSAGAPPHTLLVKQFRPPVRTRQGGACAHSRRMTPARVCFATPRLQMGNYALELPAGLIDPGETPAQAALRELKEETGFVATVRGVRLALHSAREAHAPLWTRAGAQRVAGGVHVAWADQRDGALGARCACCIARGTGDSACGTGVAPDAVRAQWTSTWTRRRTRRRHRRRRTSATSRCCACRCQACTLRCKRTPTPAALHSRGCGRSLRVLRSRAACRDRRAPARRVVGPGLWHQRAQQAHAVASVFKCPPAWLARAFVQRPAHLQHCAPPAPAQPRPRTRLPSGTCPAPAPAAPSPTPPRPLRWPPLPKPGLAMHISARKQRAQPALHRAPRPRRVQHPWCRLRCAAAVQRRLCLRPWRGLSASAPACASTARRPLAAAGAWHPATSTTCPSCAATAARRASGCERVQHCHTACPRCTPLANSPLRGARDGAQQLRVRVLRRHGAAARAVSAMQAPSPTAQSHARQ
jgi:8-oxo-dGTP pyrophosphatase MutT (NUDIX family)